MKQGKLKQKGTPQSPNLVVDENWVDPEKTPGFDDFKLLNKGQQVEAWYALENRRVIAIARDKSSLERRLQALQPAVAAAPPVTVASRHAIGQPPAKPVSSFAPVKEPRKESNALSRTFHNPYNFVPFFPRAPGTDLSDGPPVPHDLWSPHHWQGEIEVLLTVETPLLLLEEEKAAKDKKDHKTFKVLERKGKPYLPPSSLKGALRSAYETITASRMPRMEGMDHRLGARLSTGEGLKLVPARVSNGMLELLEGTSTWTNSGPLGAVQYAAWLPTYRHTGNISYSNGQKPQHGDKVFVQLQKRTHRSGRFHFHEVEKIDRASGKPPTGWHEGYVCISNQNINRKHDERVFFFIPGKVRRLPITQVVSDHWRDLILDYRGVHTEEEIRGRSNGKGGKAAPSDYLGNEPGKTAWSRHIYEPEDHQEAAQLKEGTLVYARLDSKGTAVDAVFPVQISRDLYLESPQALTPPWAQSAKDEKEFSAADRVFGFVSQNKSPQNESCAWKGNVRIAWTECEISKVESFGRIGDAEGLPLAILGQPKPRQARFYVGRRDGSAQDDELMRQPAGFNRDKQLRGRKVYPHHLGLPDGHWKNAQEDRTQRGERGKSDQTWYQEYRRPKKDGKEQRDTQNRSIKGWVSPGTTFRARIQVQNLKEAELGALLYLLDAKPGQMLRVGGGKPYGFGSVSLKVVKESLRTGQEQAKDYLSLGEPPGDTKHRDDLRQKFLAALKDLCGDHLGPLPYYEQAAHGFSDPKPIHYPRASERPDPDGKAYEWFVGNERIAEGKVAHGYALPDLVGDPGLPIVKKAK